MNVIRFVLRLALGLFFLIAVVIVYRLTVEGNLVIPIFVLLLIVGILLALGAMLKGTSVGRLLQGLAIVLAMLTAALAYAEYRWSFTNPVMAVYRLDSKDKAKRHANEVEDSLAKAKVDDATGRLDPNKWRDARMAEAVVTNQLRLVAIETELTALGANSGEAPLFVSASESTPGVVRIPFSGPKYIIADGVVISQDCGERSIGPNGVAKPDCLRGEAMDYGSRNTKILWPLPLERDGTYGALIGYPNGSSRAVFLGSATVLCPGSGVPTGWIDLHINEHPLLFRDNKGGYRIKHGPASSAACGAPTTPPPVLTIPVTATR